MRDAGAREVHMRISCPPTIAPCYYGVDTPTREELIASRQTVEEIRQYLGADSLGYLSLQGLLDAVGDQKNERYCTACYTGRYPTAVPDPATLSGASGKTDGSREG
jgi:amidophosphoribosyltransferase